MQERKSRVVNLSVLAALVVVIFGNVLTNEFVWDDILFLLNVDAYRTFDLKRYFLMPGNGLEYLPIRDLSYALDFTLWGEQSTGFHFTNLALYFFNIVAVYFLSETIVATIQLSRQSAERLAPATVAFWTAAFFTLHPIHCETVNFVGGGRNTLLASLFALLSCRSFILFLECNRSSFFNWKLAAAFIWYILAILSKSTAISLPFLFLTLYPIIRCRPIITRLAATIPFFVVSGIVYFQYTSIAKSVGLINQHPNDSFSIASRISTAIQIPFFYLTKFIIPTSLSVDYGMPFSTTPGSPTVIACMIAIIVLALLVYVFRNSSTLPYVAFSWYGVTIIPVLHMLPTSTIVADRYAYLPSFAFCLLLAYLGVGLKDRWPYRITTAGVAICLVFGILSFNQNKVWKSNLTLWRHTIAISPRSVQAMENLGTIYFFKGERAKALDILNGVRQIEPLNPVYDFFEGKYFYERDNFTRATISFEHAIEKKNDLIDALYYLADICDKTKNIDCAISYYQRLLASKDLDRGNYKKIAKERLAKLGASNVP